LTASLREIAPALGHARKNGAGGYVCSCPCHDDQHASLSLREGRDGKLLFRCHAGCDQAQLVDEFKRRGWLNDASTERDRKHETPRVTQARIVEAYAYTDESGNLLYEVLRYEPKDFKQRRPNGDGWVWSLGDCRRVPYRLPELLEAVSFERTIFIVEGERKVDLLRRWNIPATCNSGGAEKWLPEFSTHFKGADVVLLPDNDAPGRKHVETVAGSLVATGAAVRVLNLPGLGPKGDIVDWAAAGGTPEQFHALIDRDARQWQAPEGNGLDHHVETGPYVPPGELQPKFQLVAWKDITFEMEEEWAVEGVFPRVGLSCVYGGPGTIKTFIVMDLYQCMAAGGFWAGRAVKQGAVVYIAAEGSNGIKKRIAGLKKIRALKGLPEDIPFYLISKAPNFGTGEADRIELIRDIEALGVHPVAIGIDTAAQSMGGADENGQGMAMLVTNATALFNHFKCLVTLIHHVPLADEERLRGKTDLIGALDLSLLSKREKGALVATLTIKKLKDEDQEQSFTVHLVRAVLGTSKSGREVSTLVVESVEESSNSIAAPSKPKSIPASMRLLISVVQQAITESEDAPFKPFADGPLVKAVSDDVVRRRYYSRMAEKAEPDEDPKKLGERQRKAFGDAVKGAIKREILMACTKDGVRVLWLPF